MRKRKARKGDRWEGTLRGGHKGKSRKKARGPSIQARGKKRGAYIFDRELGKGLSERKWRDGRKSMLGVYKDGGEDPREMR